jgi:hypothetical protein
MASLNPGNSVEADWVCDVITLVNRRSGENSCCGLPKSAEEAPKPSTAIDAGRCSFDAAYVEALAAMVCLFNCGVDGGRNVFYGATRGICAPGKFQRA